MRIIKIEANGYVAVQDIDKSLEAMQAAIGGGYIELIRLQPRNHPIPSVDAWVDEDGRAKDLPVNVTATRLCKLLRVKKMLGDGIRGAMIITGADDDGNTLDCPRGFIESFMNKFLPACQKGI